MSTFPTKAKQASLVLATGILALGSAFFVFYTVRLLVVTRGLRAVRAGGHGAYAGAVVFPILALLLGWLGWRVAGVVRGRRTPTDG